MCNNGGCVNPVIDYCRNCETDTDCADLPNYCSTISIPDTLFQYLPECKGGACDYDFSYCDGTCTNEHECVVAVGDECTEDTDCDDSDANTYDACIMGECVSEAYEGDVLCEVVCPAQYEQVRVWWAFTDQDVLSGQLIVLSETEMCEWGEMAFEYNCFTPNGSWGGYSEAEVECWAPYGYEVAENADTNHGKVIFDESCFD